jgi:hypothetical protein
MKPKSGRLTRLRRIEDLDSRSVDGSGLAAHSPAWLARWHGQVHLYETGQPHVQLTLEAICAVIQAIPDEGNGGDPATTRAA